MSKGPSEQSGELLATAQTAEGNQLLQAVLDGLIEGCQLIGFDGTYLYLNDAAARHGRLPKGETLGRAMGDVFPGIERTPMFSRLRRCMQERMPDRMENEFVFPDGSTRWFELRFEPTAAGVIILSSDIHERKRAETRLTHLNAILRGIRCVNQLIIREQNPRLLVEKACEMLVESRGCLSACIVLGDSERINELAAAGPESKVRMLTAMLRSGRWPECMGLALGRSRPVVRWDPSVACPGCPMHDGWTEARDAVAIGLRSHRGAHGAMLVVMPPDRIGVPEELDLLCEIAGDLGYALGGIEAGEALRKSETLNRTLIEHLPQRVFLKDRSSNYISCNASYAGDLGISPEQIVGKDDYAFFPRELAAAYRADDQVVMHSGQPKDAEETYVVEGVARWIHMVKVPYHDDEGRVVGVLGIFEDITDRTRAAREREQLESQLLQAQKMEAVGRLAGGIAHDFNNLLSVILNYAAFAIEALPESDPLCEDIQQIRKAGQRAANLTRQLLAFSRKQVIRPDVLNLSDVVGEVEGMLKRIVGEDVAIVSILATDLVPVSADRAQIEQVIMNLAVNARDAMPNGGTLTLATANREVVGARANDPVKVQPGTYAMLSVFDDGCGMDEPTRARLFEPFFTTKGPGKGTGLGLATVYGIVKRSGGEIVVSSEPAKGTRFDIFFPCCTEPAADGPRSARPSAHPVGGETVLLVEDEEAVRALTERILTAAGYRVLSAANGTDALRVCGNHTERLHLVLTDVIMPEMSGRELADLIASSRPDTRVLYMSGYTENAIAHHGVLDAGTHLIDKPFTASELTRMVRYVLDEEQGEPCEGGGPDGR